MIEQVRPLTLLVGRVVLGVIFVMHGIQKLGQGMGATAEGFASMGIPLAGIAGPGVILLELVGGVALILGALLPLFGTLLALNMLGALVLVHLSAGFFASDGGFEFVLALAGLSLVVGFSGGGALAVDQLWQGKLGRGRSAASEETANA